MLTNLSHFNIRHLAESALKGSTTSSIHIITKAVHPLDKMVKTAGVWRGLTAEESLVRHRGHQLASNEEIRFLAQLLHKLVSWRTVEHVVLNRHIFVVQLRHQAERWHVGNTVTESCLSEFRCQILRKAAILARMNGTQRRAGRGH